MTVDEIPEQDQRSISQLAPGISVPKRMAVRGDKLIWQADGTRHYVDTDKVNGFELLTSFAALADETKPERFLAFARRWGVLCICRLHGCPASYCQPQDYDITPADKRCGYETWHEEVPMDTTRFYDPPPRPIWELRVRFDGGRMVMYEGGNFGDSRPSNATTDNKESEVVMVCGEPLSAWRPLAKEVRAVLNLALSIHNEQPGEPADWATLQSPNGPFAGKPGWPDTSGKHGQYRAWWFTAHARSDPLEMKKLSDALGGILDHDGKSLNRAAQIRVGRGHLAEVVNDWLELARLRPHFFWHGHTNQRVFWLQAAPGGELIGTIATQLMFTVHGTPGFAICESCKQPTFLRPHQSASKHVYCERSYCKKGAQAAASKRYRERNRANSERKRQPIAKLRPKEIQTIKRRLARATGPLRSHVLELAAQFKVSPTTIYRHAK